MNQIEWLAVVHLPNLRHQTDGEKFPREGKPDVPRH
jgi:hypothetical protein